MGVNFSIEPSVGRQIKASFWWNIFTFYRSNQQGTRRSLIFDYGKSPRVYFLHPLWLMKSNREKIYKLSSRVIAYGKSDWLILNKSSGIFRLFEKRLAGKLPIKDKIKCRTSPSINPIQNVVILTAHTKLKMNSPYFTIDIPQLKPIFVCFIFVYYEIDFKNRSPESHLKQFFLSFFWCVRTTIYVL